MRLGITTNCFATAIASGEIDLAGILEFAGEEGFLAAEIRDAAGDIPLDELDAVVEDAASREMALSYAVNNDCLIPGDRDTLTGAVIRAAACGEGTVARILASQSVLAEKSRKGYTAAETDRIVMALRDYADIAAEKGIVLALEHAGEPLYGDGDSFFGLHDIIVALEATGGMPSSLALTFDPANAVFTALCKAPVGPEKVFEFLGKHSHYIAMVHYKTTSSGELSPVIADADIDNERLFEELSAVYDGVLCLEVPAAETLDECRSNVLTSLEYMRKNGLMGYLAQ